MGRGRWGEGITGTTIKDTWTKSRGRVEAGEEGEFGWGGVEGWGENTDNFNWITIKIFFKKEKKTETSVGKDVEKLEPLCIDGRTIKWCSYYVKFGTFSKS